MLIAQPRQEPGIEPCSVPLLEKGIVLAGDTEAEERQSWPDMRGDRALVV